LFPAASLTVDATNLLFKDRGVPLGVELYDDPTRLVKVKPLPADLALGD
jgi:hypothetical protein